MFNTTRVNLKDFSEEGAGKFLDPKLMDELAQSGVKFTRENVVGITKMPDGKITFLETGNADSGLHHILYGKGTASSPGHLQDFLNCGVNNKEEIVELIMTTVKTQDGVVRNGATVYNVVLNGKAKELHVIISSNGYIVTAFPKSI